MNFLTSLLNKNRGLTQDDFLHIPEPTRSLLWVTNEDPSKRKSPFTIEVVVTLSLDGVTSETNPSEGDFLSEPSLIWTRLPIEKNYEIEKEAMYYPSYFALDPKQRFQYLWWLRDITQETNLSYVFLYFYGLERHLLIGNYDLAVEEIARLLKSHKKSSFVSYATHALIAASVFRGRADILERGISGLLTEIDNLSLAIKSLRNEPIIAEEIVSIAPYVGFKNKRYIKNQPGIFLKNVRENLKSFEENEGRLLEVFDLKDLQKEEAISFANPSVPRHIRSIPVPDLIGHEGFQKIVQTILQSAHEQTKEELKNRRKKSVESILTKQ